MIAGEKLEDIHRLSDVLGDIRREFGREEFRCTAHPELGVQRLWVAGNSYSHRGWELAAFPMFMLLVVEEKEEENDSTRRCGD